MRTKIVAVKIMALTLVMALTLALAGCPDNKGGTPSLTTEQRVALAAAAIPELVRELRPNMDAELLALIDAGANGFNAFFGSPSLTNWQRAERAWEIAIPALRSLNNSSLNTAVTIINALRTQVTVIAPPEGSKSPALVVTTFEEQKVRELERAIKDLKKQTK
jgi:hypothetical protein